MLAACARWLPLTLACIAAVFVMSSAQDSRSLLSQASATMRDAGLSEAEASRIAQVLPAVLPFIVFAVVFCILSMAVNVALCTCGCLCGSQHAQRQAVLLPLDETPYTQYPSVSTSWSSGLCACMEDVPLCFTACCLPYVTVGQLYERVVRHRGACLLITISIGGTMLLSGPIASTFWCGAGHSQQRDDNPICRLGSTATSACVLVLVILLATARKAVRQAHGIAPQCCGEGCDDICAACCCLPLAAAQAMRHLGAHEQAPYSIASPTGSKSTHQPFSVPPPTAAVPMGLPVA